jgi:hypothetical protein
VHREIGGEEVRKSGSQEVRRMEDRKLKIENRK